MDVGSINEKLLLNLQRAQIEQVTLVSKSLGLKVGSQFLAQVEKVTQATPNERSEIIKAIDITLAQLNKNSAAPATQALINQLLEQKKMLQDPSIKLVSLTTTPQISIGTSYPLATNPTTQNLLTYTNQPLQNGQTLLLQITENSRLQILQPLTQKQLEILVQALQKQGIGLPHNSNASSEKSNLNPATHTIQITRELAIQLAKIDLGKLLAEHTQTGFQKIAVNEKIQTAISESLRNLLPRKDSGQDLLATLPKIAQFIQQIPIAQRQEWLPAQVQDALKGVANHIRLSDQLNNPKLLAMALNNNGQSFEHKLSELLHTSSKTASSGNFLQNKPAADILKNTASPLNNLLNSTKLSALNSSNGSINAAPPEIEKIIAQDLKGSLLGLLHELDSEIHKITASSPNQPDLTKTILLNALPQFLGLLMNKQQGELNQKQLRTQLMLLMHQYTLGSIAKIQLQQIHTISQQLNQVDVTQPNQSWQFEIPVRHGQDVHPLQIHLEQRWMEEKQDDTTQQGTRVRQWNVMLNFDLPLVGKFYAQLRLLGQNLNAKFWAEHENTLAEARQKIDFLTNQLEQQGIHVSQIQCVPGLPPKPKMLLSYSLVDVKT